MTEFVPAARPEVRLSFEDRLYIIQTVNALPLQQFDELVFALDPPKGIIPPESAAQGSRSKALLDWVEGPTGPGLAVIDKYLQRLIPKATKTAARLTAFAISGRLGDLSTAEIEAIVQLLRQKTGDDSIDLAFFEEGSIKLVLSGSAEGLEKLQELFESGELAEVLEDFPVEYVQAVNSDTTAERKARFIQALRLSSHNRLISCAYDLANDIASVHARASDLVRAFDQASNNVLDPAIAFGQVEGFTRAYNEVGTLAQDLANRAKDLDYVRDLANDLADSFNTIHYFLQGLANARAHSSPRGFPLTTDRALSYAKSYATDLADFLTDRLALANNFASTLATHRIIEVDLSGVDLSEIDLRGANLKGLDLKGISLAGTNLTHAIVEEAVFGDNPGLSKTAKDDLRRRGAIIQDTPGSNTSALVGR